MSMTSMQEKAICSMSKLRMKKLGSSLKSLPGKPQLKKVSSKSKLQEQNSMN